MKAPWFLIFCCVAGRAVADPSTHCGADEFTFFSCPVWGSGPEKDVSLCGGLGDREESWVQYRFGAIENPEMVYPKQRKGSTEKFFGHFERIHADQGPTSIQNIWFKVGVYRYLVENEGVVVYKDWEPIKTLACAQPTVDHLGSLKSRIQDAQGDDGFFNHK